MTLAISTNANLQCRADRAWRQSTRIVVIALAIAFVIVSPHYCAGWASMLVNCTAVFLVLKHCVWLAAQGATREVGVSERLAFYMLWPGFDADAFLASRDGDRVPPAIHEWIYAAAKTAFAVGVLWVLLPFVGGKNTMILGIGGMLGGVLLIHCGLFHFVTLAWQISGRGVVPIMNQPLAATSLADFWGRRWNLAFRDAAALVLFRPLARRFSARVATMLTFLASGLWHEAVISIPAGDGYGMPTLYFLFQGAGMWLQRRHMRGAAGPRSAWLGRATTVLVVVAPLPLLFHRPFAQHVVVPLLHVLGVLRHSGG